MKNIFLTDDIELIEGSTRQNLTTEDKKGQESSESDWSDNMQDLENQSDLEFFKKEQEIQRNNYHEPSLSLRLVNFIKFKSDFFVCDERIMFEAFLIKFQAFGFKTFFWSRKVIFDEIGIKKDRADKIIKRFIDLGIINSKELVKTTINSKPRQINHYDLNQHRILELIPDIYIERENSLMEKELKKYLFPVVKKK